MVAERTAVKADGQKVREEHCGYEEPEVKTYTSDELEDLIGPALTGSGFP